MLNPLSLYHPDVTLSELLERALNEHTNRIALRCQGETLSYEKLREKSEALAASFQQELNLKPGDRIALFMPNIMQFIISCLAALKIGLVIVNINPLYTPRELAKLLADAQPKAIIFLEHFHKTLSEVDPTLWPEFLIMTSVADPYSFFKRQAITFWIHYMTKDVPPLNSLLKRKVLSWLNILNRGKNLSLRPYQAQSTDLAFLQYTGGTTGDPKGAMLSQHNMAANVLQASQWLLDYHPDAKTFRIATALPLYHIFSLTANFLTFFLIGSENLLIINPRKIDDFIAQWRRYPIQGLCGVNTLFAALLKHPDFHTLDKSTLKIALGGGMAVSQTVAEQWQERTHLPIMQAYGLTEASPAVSINPLNLTSFHQSIGFPLAMTETKCVDEQGEDGGVGYKGELWVRGPQVMLGYWNKPEQTAEVLTSDGWLKTGDIGYKDEEGRIYLVDRKKEMIIVSGFNVYPSEIEEVLRKHPLIDDVAVVGHQDNEGNEEVVAFFVLKGQEAPPSGKELHDFCEPYLTRYKIPKKYHQINSLPKSAVGKILKKDLKEHLKTLYL